MTDPQSPPVGAVPGMPVPPVPPADLRAMTPPAVWPPPEWPPLPPGYYYPLPQPGQPGYPYASPSPQQPAVPPQSAVPAAQQPVQHVVTAAPAPVPAPVGIPQPTVSTTPAASSPATPTAVQTAPAAAPVAAKLAAAPVALNHAPAPTPGAPVAATAKAMPASKSTARPTTPKSNSPASSTASKPTPKYVAPSYRDRLQTVTFQEWTRRRLREAPGYIVSVVLHIVVLSSLSLLVIPAKDREELFNTIMAEAKEQVEVTETLDDTQIVPENLDNLEATAATMQVNAEIVTEKPSPLELDVSDSAPMIEAPDPTAGNGPIMPKGALAGRSQKGRSALVAAQGGTAGSEQAVNSGLKWLAKQQRPDGSWSFKHGPDDPGALDNPTGATGLALLAFLGGGHTHKSGDYQKQVAGGLSFLGSKMVVTGAGGDLRLQGDMYTQGICTIALCEAYALSKDKNLKQPTQLAINFIVNAQDAAGGGWRYQPGTKGDTSVVGWQVMALKSGKIANLQIPNKTIGKATFFLNNVQAENGAKYGYDTPGAGMGTTAVGLLCRMYLGWTPKNQGLVKGVEYLSTIGPQPGNIYFDYYATQVLHHWGGEPWTKWNNVMREYLVTTQEKSGEAAGSWAPTKSHDDVAGGRLYRTCMSVMTLEVYYRHLPLYQRETIKVDF